MFSTTCVGGCAPVRFWGLSSVWMQWWFFLFYYLTEKSGPKGSGTRGHCQVHLPPPGMTAAKQWVHRATQ